MMAEILRTKGSLFCVHHPKNKLIVLCEECNVLVCSKCFLGKHKGHDGRDIEEAVEEKYRNIDDFTIKTECTTIPSLKQHVENIKEKTDARLKVLQTSLDEAYHQEEVLIELVKMTTQETVSVLIEEIQTTNLQLLQFQVNFDKLLIKLEEAVHECKETKRSENDIMVIDVADEVNSIKDHCVQSPQHFPKRTFIPGYNPVEKIKVAFGHISEEEFFDSGNTPESCHDIQKPSDRDRARENGGEGRF